MAQEEKTREEAKRMYKPIKSYWITDKADKELPTYAEELGKKLVKNGLTNSKIRSIYGEIKRIQTGDYKKCESSFFLLRPKMAYAAGREGKNIGVQLFKFFFDDAYTYVNDEKPFKNFCNLIEAVLAYHKAYGGKEN